MKYKEKSWIGFSIATFFLYGLTNFILGYIGEASGNSMSASVTSIFLLWTGMGIMASIFTFTPLVSFQKIRDSFRNGSAGFGIAAGFTLALGMFTLKTGFITDPGSKGPIVAIASANAMLVALASWIFLKEKLSVKQFLGMLIILSGLALISFSNSSSSSLLGAVFGLSTLFLFGSTNYLLKYAGHKGGSSITVTFLLWITTGTTGIIVLTFSLGSGRGLKGLHSTDLVILSIVAGFVLGLGMLTLKAALKRGPGGPAVAISGSNSMLVLLLDLAVFGHLPNPLKVTGMVIIILGISLIVLVRRNPGR